MNTRKVRTQQYVVEFPVTGVLDTDKETAQVAAKIIESLHSGASFGIPAGGGWSIETIWSVKRLAWMAFAGLIIHGLLVCAGLSRITIMNQAICP